MAKLIVTFVLLQLMDGLTTILGITTGRAKEINFVFGVLNTHPWIAVPVKVAGLALTLYLLRYLIESDLSRFWINFILVLCVVVTGGAVLNNVLLVLA